MKLNPITFAKKRPRVAIAIAVVAVVGISFGLYWFQPWRLWTKQVVNESLPTVAGAVVPGDTTKVTVPPLLGGTVPTAPTPSAETGAGMERPETQDPTAGPSAATESTAPAAPPTDPATEQPVATEPPVATDQPVAEQPAEQPVEVPVTPAPSAEPVVLFSGDFVTQEHATSGTLKILQLADGSRYVRVEGFSTSDGPDLHVALTDQAAGGDWFKYKNNRYHDLGALKGTDGDQNYLIPADVDLNGLTSVVIWCERFSVAFGSAPLNQP